MPFCGHWAISTLQHHLNPLGDIQSGCHPRRTWLDNHTTFLPSHSPFFAGSGDVVGEPRARNPIWVQPEEHTAAIDICFRGRSKVIFFSNRISDCMAGFEKIALPWQPLCILGHSCEKKYFWNKIITAGWNNLIFGINIEPIKSHLHKTLFGCYVWKCVAMVTNLY